MTFDPREGHAVVARHDDQGVVEPSGLLQRGQHPAEVPVGVFHLVGVVEQVVAYDLVVGPVAGHAVDVRGLLAAQTRAGARLIVAVRLDWSGPEEPRPVRRRVAKELLEVRRVVVVGDPGGRRLGLGLVVGLAGVGARLALGVEHAARAPDLARRRVEVAARREGLREDAVLRGKDALVVRRRAELPRVAPRHDRRTRRRALGRRRVGVREEQAFAGDPVEVRGLDPAATVGAGMAHAPVVHDEEQDVRSLDRRLGGGEGRGQQRQAGEQRVAHHRGGIFLGPSPIGAMPTCAPAHHSSVTITG